MNKKLSISIFVTILSLLISASGVSAQSVDPPAHPLDQLSPQATFQRMWLSTGNNTTDASVVMDASGGLHVGMAAYTADAGIYPAYYVYCPSNCTQVASWTFTSMGNLGSTGGYVRLALDSAGHPRMIWHSDPSITEAGVYQYSECSSNCTNASQWTTVTLASDAIGSEATRYFTLDQQGRPRYVYSDTGLLHMGTYYAYCDAGCTTAGNWHDVKISVALQTFDFSLAFTPSGGVRLAYRDASNVVDNVTYAMCDTGCNSSANWSLLPLYDIGYGAAFSLHLDAQNRPRLALYSGYYGSGDPMNDLLFYTWCNSACTQSANWDSYSLGLPTSYGFDVDMALDQAGQPSMAFYVDSVSDSAYGLGYAKCTANCEDSSTATWQTGFVETMDDLNASDPISVKSGCSLSYWLEVGQNPSIVLDSAGNPRIGYTAKHYQGGSCTIHEDIRLVRFAQFGGGSTPGQYDHWTYLPFVRGK